MSNPISGIATAATLNTSGAAQGPKEWGFMETLRGAMDQVGEMQGAADEKVSAVLEGNGMDVHSAMIAVEKADLSFQLMMQVRNKIVAAYQEISRMQF
ncbi:MAG TPA: flagellar hook-basal body complex protein FliE [Terracidiphilus sp.]|jgi:flagellar hook-basal body complex protein FliE|nr:flagellar hook-basal body complex protein FliE [Terriglobales bacterium]HEX4756867.1 flagellar hook-basal body complex protein FliE [Terracidiphilus sp.]